MRQCKNARAVSLSGICETALVSLQQNLPPPASARGHHVSRLRLTFACGIYDRTDALRTGDVGVEGIDLNFLAIEAPREIFDRMGANQEFDVAEFSSSEFISRLAR